MPWSPNDADRFKKGLSDKQKRQWAAIANAALQRGSGESSAIRQASGSLRSGAVESAARRRLKQKMNTKSSVTGAHT
jgi:uncharacterized protein YdaT